MEVEDHKTVECSGTEGGYVKDLNTSQEEPPDYTHVMVVDPTHPSAPPQHEMDTSSSAQEINLELHTTHNPGVTSHATSRDDIGCGQGCRHTMHCKSIWLASVMMAFIIVSIITMNPLFLIGTAVTYLIHLIESCCSSTKKYLKNSLDQDAVQELITKIHKTPPIIRWHVECYHYETRHYTETRTDSHGRTHTEHRTEQIRVNTHSASTTFRFESWKDVSDPWTTESDYKMTKITCHSKYTLADEYTKNQYLISRNAFTAANDRDVYQDFSENLVINGLVTKILAEMEPGVAPCCLTSNWFCLWSLAGCGLCYRCWFSSIVGRKKYWIVKEVSC